MHSEVMEATLTLTSAPALVSRPESKPVAGRRAGNRGEAWGRLGMAMSTRGSMASPAAEAMRGRIAQRADGGEKGREDETRSEERHVGQGYD